MPIKKKGGMGRVGQCPLRNLVAWALPIGQWALNGHFSNTTLSLFWQFKIHVCNLTISVVGPTSSSPLSIANSATQNSFLEKNDNYENLGQNSKI